jgi:SAM-dependent methyltransferase
VPPRLSGPLGRPEILLGWLSSENSAVIYAHALELQAELHEKQIRTTLSGLAAWRSARRILDAGCGPGQLPVRFKDLIAGKEYVGIDKERYFIAQARKKTVKRRDLKFVRADLFKFRGRRFDLIYLWAVLQHLPSVERALKHLKGLLNPGGNILVYDSSGGDAMVKLSPEVPAVRSMYDALARLERAKGRNNDPIRDVRRLAGGFGFRISFERPISFSVSSPKSKRQFVRFVFLVSELLNRFYSIKSDRREMLADLTRWASLAESKVDMADGGAWLLLESKVERPIRTDGRQ